MDFNTVLFRRPMDVDPLFSSFPYTLKHKVSLTSGTERDDNQPDRSDKN